MKIAFKNFRRIISTTGSISVFLFSSVILTVLAFCNIVNAIIVSEITNQIQIPHFDFELRRMVFILIFYLAMVGISCCARILSEKLRIDIKSKLRKQLTRTIVEAKASSVKNFASGEMLVKYVKNIDGSTSLAAEAVPSLISSIAIGVFIFAYMLIRMSFVSIIYFISLIVVLKYQNAVGKDLMEKAQAANSDYTDMMSMMEQNVRHSKLIRVGLYEDFFADKTVKKQNKYSTSVMNVFKTQALSITYSSIINILPLFLLTTLMAVLISKGKINVGDFVGFLMLTNIVQGTVNSLPFSVMNILNLSADANAFFETLDVMGSKERVNNDREVQRGDNRNVLLDNLSLVYDKKTVLDGISLSFDSNQRIAVIGKSGAGKSSLLGIFARRVRDYQGDVLFPIDLKNMVYITQNMVFYPDTLRNMMTMIAPEIDDATIRKLLGQLEIDEFLADFEQGIDTFVQSDGAPYSKGQMQRILILLAVMRRQAKMIVMDEPTGALDVKLKSKIMKSILDLTADKGLIIATHDIDNLNDFDKVLWLENGKVKEFSEPELVLPKYRDSAPY